MIEFFKHYISPESPARAKLAIHLHAQGTSPASEIPLTVTGGVKDLSITPKVEAVLETAVEKKEGTGPIGTATNPYIIENVREFKSRLAVSAGPQPVKDLSEFEETDPKL